MPHVLGGGALGTLFAAHGPPATTLLLRRSSEALQSGQLLLRVHRGWTAEQHESHVAVEPSSGAGPPIQTLVIATKAFSVSSALDDVRQRLAPDATVVLLCNGALSLADALSLPDTTSLLVATTTHGAWLHPPREDDYDAERPAAPSVREVQHAGDGSTWIGPLRDAGSDAAAAAALSAAQGFAAWGLRVTVETAEQTKRRLWLKLAANAVLNPLTALWDVQNGDVLRRDEGRRMAVDVCDELAVLPGAPPAAALLDFVHSCAEENGANWSSMHQDVQAGRRTEIEHLNGWVADRLRAHKTTTWANRRLAFQIEELEARRASYVSPS